MEPLVPTALEMAAKLAKDADENLKWQIREARTEGLSLRKIAAVTGLSHESVRRICTE